MAEFRFTNEHRPSEAGKVASVLARPRLWIPTKQDYPDFDTWLMKTEAQIAGNNKRAMLSYAGSQPVGAVIYQRHETLPNTISIRNISVSPDSQGRYIGSFLLRNTEIEASQHDFPECTDVIVDTKITNSHMINFLVAHGYRVDEVADLYGLNAGLDAVLVKSIPQAAV